MAPFNQITNEMKTQDSKHTKETKHKWPDSVRLEMIEKSEWYHEPRIYQFGYYDGWQDAQKQNKNLLKALRKIRTHFYGSDISKSEALEIAEQAIKENS